MDTSYQFSFDFDIQVILFLYTQFINLVSFMLFSLFHRIAIFCLKTLCIFSRKIEYFLTCRNMAAA